MAANHADLAAALDASTSEASTLDTIDEALDAYTFAYPLLVMDATSRVATCVDRADTDLGSGAPINQFSHLRHLLGIELDVPGGALDVPGGELDVPGGELDVPGGELDGVSRPSLDTLYSFLWFDVSKAPLVVSVPASHERFFTLSLIDLYANVFASLGTRTTGTGAQTFTITAPSWRGALPQGVPAYPSPTTRGWLFGLVQVRGLADLPEVARFQSALQAAPWKGPSSTWRDGPAPGSTPAARGSAAGDPVAMVSRLTPSEFFTRFCELSGENPPRAEDAAIVDRLRRLGIVPGRRFVPEEMPRAVRSALERVQALLPQRLEAAHRHGFRSSNHWRAPLGVESTDYLQRACRVHAGIGASSSEDAVDFTTASDASGCPLRSSTPYSMTFRPGCLPPTRAFWSLTLYDERQKLAPNAIGRHTLGSNDDLRLEPDGSLTVHIQREVPGEKRKRNWLPAPDAGKFSLSLRLYWPERAVLDGEWEPPPLQHAEPLPAPCKLWFARDRFEWTDDA